MNTPSDLSLILFLSLLQPCFSAGILHVEFTSDSSSLLWLDHQIGASSETLTAFTSKNLVIHTNGFGTDYLIRFRLLDKKGTPFADETHVFRLENNGKRSEMVISAKGVSLLVRATFSCEKGYFGDFCQHISRAISSIPSTTTVASSTQSIHPSSNKILIYTFTIILLAVFLVLYCCYPRRRSQVTKANPLKGSTVTLQTTGILVAPPQIFSKYNFTASPNYYIDLV